MARRGLRLLVASALCLSAIPAGASAYELCTNATLIGGSRSAAPSTIEIGGIPHALDLRFGVGPVCGTDSQATGAIRARISAQGLWITCSGEVPVGPAVGSTSDNAQGANRVTINLVVQYVPDAMPWPYNVTSCGKE